MLSDIIPITARISEKNLSCLSKYNGVVDLLERANFNFSSKIDKFFLSHQLQFFSYIIQSALEKIG